MSKGADGKETSKKVMEMKDISKLRHFAMLNKTSKLKDMLEKLSKEKITHFPSRHCYSPLHQAASRGSLESLRLLLEYGFDVNLVDKGDNTALHEACRAGHHHIALELLDRKNISVKMKNRVGATPLHFACMRGLGDIARELIRRGANAYACTTLQTLAVDYAENSLRDVLIQQYELIIQEKTRMRKCSRLAAKVACEAAEAAVNFSEDAKRKVYGFFAAAKAAEAAKLAATFTKLLVDGAIKDVETALMQKFALERDDAITSANLATAMAFAAAQVASTNATKAVKELREQVDSDTTSASSNTSICEEDSQPLHVRTDVSPTNSVTSNADLSTGVASTDSKGNDSMKINSTGKKNKKQELKEWLEQNMSGGPSGPASIVDMTVQDVHDFLMSIGLKLIAEACLSQDLDGEMLAAVTTQDLEELKLGERIHRYKLMQILKRYRATQSSPTNNNEEKKESDTNYSKSAPNSPRSTVTKSDQSIMPTSAPTSPQNNHRGTLGSEMSRRRSSSGSAVQMESTSMISITTIHEDRDFQPSRPRASSSGNSTSSATFTMDEIIAMVNDDSSASGTRQGDVREGHIKSAPRRPSDPAPRILLPRSTSLPPVNAEDAQILLPRSTSLPSVNAEDSVSDRPELSHVTRNKRIGEETTEESKNTQLKQSQTAVADGMTPPRMTLRERHDSIGISKECPPTPNTKAFMDVFQSPDKQNDNKGGQ